MTRVLVLLSIVGVMISLWSDCAAQADSEAEESARQVELRLAARSLDTIVGYAIRLERISAPIRLHGAPLCGDKLAPVLGVVVADRDELPWALHDPARDRFDLDERVRVLWVLPEFPAARAGLRVGDVIISVNGDRIEDADEIRRFKPDEGEAILVKIRRDETFLTLELEHWPGCYSPADVQIGSRINAYADGELIVVFTGFLRFFEDDDHVALVVGHELAHNVLDHKWSQPHEEAEADYLGCYFAARAGFDISDAGEVFRQLGLLSVYNSAPGSARSHPTSPARMLALRTTLQQIQSKLANGAPLEPDFWR